MKEKNITNNYSKETPTVTVISKIFSNAMTLI